MIVTVTPNPSIDRTLAIPALVRGELVRAESAMVEAGGKGINVARALATQGHESLVVAPLSAASASVFEQLLAGVPLEAVPVREDLRTNVTLVEADGTVTKVNERGPTLTAAEIGGLLTRVAERAHGARWVVGCGRLPPGAAADFYARLVRAAPLGTRVAIDADGIALAASVAAGPALIKPNHHELEELIGRPLPTLGAVLDAARQLVSGGAGAVLVSLGPDGAAFVDRHGAAHAEGRVARLRNPVGAGDALLAGFLAGDANADALAEAVAWSLAACRSPGSRMAPVDAEDRAAVTLHRHADPERMLAA